MILWCLTSRPYRRVTKVIIGACREIWTKIGINFECFGTNQMENQKFIFAILSKLTTKIKLTLFSQCNSVWKKTYIFCLYLVSWIIGEMSLVYKNKISTARFKVNIEMVYWRASLKSSDYYQPEPASCNGTKGSTLTGQGITLTGHLQATFNSP